MPKSMTGFGRATAEADGVLWTVEVTSVNSRFLEAQIRLPRAVAGSEFALRRRVTERLGRGKITVSINWDALSDATPSACINRPLAESYIKQLRELQEATSLGGAVSVDVVAGLPDVFASPLEAGDREGREKRLLSALDQAIDNLEEMRVTEGRKLALDIRSRIEAIASELEELEGEAEAYAVSLAERVRERMQKLFLDIGIDPQRLAQEAAFLAERCDITEERVRLAAHLGEFLRTLDEGGPMGRRFNFLLQEMVRETNTIGSKTGELGVIQRVVRIKEELEKIREQVQNLE